MAFGHSCPSFILAFGQLVGKAVQRTNARINCLRQLIWAGLQGPAHLAGAKSCDKRSLLA